MSDYRTKAVAQVEVNGNAGPELVKLKQRAEDFRDAIARAYKEGNDKLAKKLTKDLKSRSDKSRISNPKQPTWSRHSGDWIRRLRRNFGRR